MINQTGKFVHELVLPVRWYDMDALGHVNTSIYFTYFEQARISWWIKIAPNDVKFEKTGPVVVKASCNYLKSIIFPETLLIKLYVGPPGRSSYESSCLICSENNPDIVYAEAFAKIVWIDREVGKSVPLPEVLRQCLPEV